MKVFAMSHPVPCRTVRLFKADATNWLPVALQQSINMQLCLIAPKSLSLNLCSYSMSSCSASLFINFDVCACVLAAFQSPCVTIFLLAIASRKVGMTCPAG